MEYDNSCNKANNWNLNNFELIQTHFEESNLYIIFMVNYIRYRKNKKAIPILILGTNQQYLDFIKTSKNCISNLSLKDFRKNMKISGIISRYFDDNGFNQNDLINLKNYYSKNIIFLDNLTNIHSFPIDIICLNEFKDLEDFNNNVSTISLKDYSRKPVSLLSTNFLYLVNNYDFINHIFIKYN